MALALGVLAALTSAVLYASGVTLQSIEAAQAPDEESLKPSLLQRLVTRKRWILGTLCVIGGWATQAGALMLAPITIVQPALAGSVGVLLVIGVGFFGGGGGGPGVVPGPGLRVRVGGVGRPPPRPSGGPAPP